MRILFLLFCVASTAFADKAFLSFSQFPPARHARWTYAQPIVALREKSLWDYPADVDIYRFIDCPCFSPCILVNIIKKGSQVTFTGTQLGGNGGFNIVGVAATETHELSKKEWSTFNRLLQKSNFWAMPNYIDRMGLDY